MKHIATLCLLLFLVFSSCTYRQKVDVVVPTFESAVKTGQWNLDIDTGAVSGEIQVRGLHCSAHSYSLTDASESVRTVLNNAVTSQLNTGHPESTDRIRIAVRRMNLIGRVDAGFWSSTVNGIFEMRVVMTVTRDGKENFHTFSTYQTEAHKGPCGHISRYTKVATERGLEDIADQIVSTLTQYRD